jgi:hypothetical protein
MGKVRAIVTKELREALPATIFFLLLFHMIALTKAVVLDDYTFDGLRAAGATLGALIVAKAILVVEALPIASWASRSGIVRILWKTLLYGIVVLLFRLVEELIHVASKHGGLAAGAKALVGEVAWPLFGVVTLWTLAGLLLYCLAAELVRNIGAGRVRQIILGDKA